jgi:hypothetical protein
VKRGQPAPFTVHVWVNNWTPAGKITISLSTVKPGQQARFTTSGCHKRSSCTIAAPGKTPAELHAQVTAKHTATSITVKAVGQASAATLVRPLAVSGSVQFIAPATAPDAAPDLAPSAIAIQPGPLPTLSEINSSKLMSPGNAAGLFPSIVPSTAPTLAPATHPGPASTRTAQAVKVLPLGMSTMTEQIIGIIAMVLAVALAVLVKLLPRRRTK